MPSYGHNRQFAPSEDTTTFLDKQGIKRVQKVVGSFLYYTRAIDNTITTALNEIALKQSKPTENTNTKIDMLLNYLATYPNTQIRFYASDMILYAASDAAYLISEGAKSRIAGYFYCSNRSNTTPPLPPINAPVHVE